MKRWRSEALGILELHGLQVVERHLHVGAATGQEQQLGRAPQAGHAIPVVLELRLLKSTTISTPAPSVGALSSPRPYGSSPQNVSPRQQNWSQVPFHPRKRRRLCSSPGIHTYIFIYLYIIYNTYIYALYLDLHRARLPDGEARDVRGMRVEDTEHRAVLQAMRLHAALRVPQVDLPAVVRHTGRRDLILSYHILSMFCHPL